MKRYLVYVGDQYYPSGAMGDLVGQADTLEEAKRLVLMHNGNTMYKWWDIVDISGEEPQSVRDNNMVTL